MSVVGTIIILCLFGVRRGGGVGGGVASIILLLKMLQK